MATNRKYVQSQVFQLTGAGVSQGDNSMTISNFNQIDGTALTMSNFGTKGYGTCQPAAGVYEEQISWTGVTVNGNGTSTLTGIKTVATVNPYTETANFAQGHAGGTAFVISNTAGFYGDFTNKYNDETVTGAWTIPNTSDSGSSQSATSDDIANAITGTSGTATNLVFGTVKLSVAAASAPNPIAVGNNDTRVPIQSQTDALVGTSGTPSSSNKYVTNDDTATTSTVSKVVRANSSGKIDSSFLIGTTSVKFGGTGTDGVLNVTSGTTTIDLGSANFISKNYTSINVSAGATLTFSNPHAGGTYISLKSQGSVTIAGTLDASGMGAAGGTGGALNTAGTSGTTANFVQDTSNHFGVGGVAQQTGGVGGVIYTNLWVYTNTANSISQRKALGMLTPGSGGSGGGGGGGASATVGGAGGRGGAALYIECADAWNFTGSITVNGLNGSNSTAIGAGPDAGSGGGGGGGAAGMAICLYNTLTANSGTLTAKGGNGGSTGRGGGGGGALGGGGGGGGGTWGGAGATGATQGGATANNGIAASLGGGASGAGGSNNTSTGTGGTSTGDNIAFIALNTEFA